MIRCRTPECGSHVERCECGHIENTKYNSCRHRSCPQCGGGRRADWLERTASELIPCEHAHVIFTVPEELNRIWQFNRKVFADLLLTAAKETLEELLADQKYLGATPGIISVLHTWGRNLSIHPHVHCLVTCGGVNSSGRFVRPRHSILIPGGVLRSKFRGKFRDFLLKAFDSADLNLPPSLSAARFRSLLNRLGRANWNVRIQDRYPHGTSVAGYLARYMTGGPISDRRLCSVEPNRILFRYRDHRDGTEKVMRITPKEFLTRWFEHVPPRGLRMIRRAGLYANASRTARKAVCEQLQVEASAETVTAKRAALQVQGLDPNCCPRCNTVVRVIRISHPTRVRVSQPVATCRMPASRPP